MDFIHRYIPPKAADMPTLVLLHGTGGDESDLVPLAQLLLPEAGLLGVRGKVLEGGAPRFFRRLAEGVFDEEDLIFRTHELADFLSQAATEYSLDASRFFALGYSNGANIAASMMLLRPGGFAGGVLFRAMVPLVPDTVPELHNTPVLLMCGTRDELISQDGSEQLANLLRSGGAKVTLNWAQAGHGLTRPELDIAKQWLTEANF